MKLLMTPALVFVLFLCSCTKEPQPSQFAEKPLFTPDFIPCQTYTVMADADTIITGSAGTRVFIAANTFVDANGSIVSGPVDIELREALKPIDMVMGNLTTLTNGEILQSGGMIYINATAQGEQLAIAADASLQMSVPSDNVLPGMQIYTGEFDSSSNQLNWVNPQDDMIPLTPAKAVEPERTIKMGDVSAMKMEQPVAIEAVPPPPPPAPPIPVEAKPKDSRIISFSFDDSTLFPELRQYENVKFRVSEESELNPGDSKGDWFSVDLQRTAKEGVYIITFTGLGKHGEVKKSYEVTPVFEGKDYKLAMAEYDQKYQQYLDKKEEIEQQRIAEAARQRELEKQQQEFARQQRENFNQQQMKRDSLRQAINEANQGRKIMVGVNQGINDPNAQYIFNIKKLGWANVDRLYKDPRTRQIDLITTIANAEEMESVNITLLMPKQNIYIPGYQKLDKTYGFTHGDLEATRLPIGESAAILVTALKDGKLFYTYKEIIFSEKQTVALELAETTRAQMEKELRAKI